MSFNRDTLTRSSSLCNKGWMSTQQDLAPTFVDILSNSGRDWLDAFNFPVVPTIQRAHRRTHSASQSTKQPVMVRKSRSLRENSRHKLKSPPPPPDTTEPLPSLPIMKRKSSLQHHHNNLSEYQGYVRHSRQGSFTYSPPPRSTSLNAPTVSKVPPVPPIPTTLANFTKKSDPPSKSDPQPKTRPISDMSNASNVHFYHQTNPININDLMPNYKKQGDNLQKEIDMVSSQQVKGRKRGKTLPGSLATPPPVPTATLPPMKLNPLKMTIPENLPTKKPSPTTRQSVSTTPSIHNKLKNTHQTPTPSPPAATNRQQQQQQQKRKSHVPVSNKQDMTVRRTVSYKQPKTSMMEETRSKTRSPNSVQTTLQFYGQYLTEYERQKEIFQYQDIYFIGPHAQKNHLNGFDDERGDYRIVIQDHLAYRYEVIQVLGRGSFGQVVKCFDHKTSQFVAIKLIRNKKRFHAQAVIEVNILKKLMDWDPEDQSCTIKMVDHFKFRNHLCIAFECLYMNLYEFIKSNHFQGFSLGLIKRFTVQIIQALVLLEKHDVIHCDLKPENIMLRYPGKSSIKVIDFGSSCLETERVYTYIQSRFYRSPEIILGISYHKGIDMWSLGCIIAELYTGIPLFPGENEQEQLACIMEIIGKPDKNLIEKSSRKNLFFDSMGNPRIIANSKGKKRMPNTKSIIQVIQSNDLVFIDFIERCLQWDPSKRMTPREALQHEWLVHR